MNAEGHRRIPIVDNVMEFFFVIVPGKEIAPILLEHFSENIRRTSSSNVEQCGNEETRRDRMRVFLTNEQRLVILKPLFSRGCHRFLLWVECLLSLEKF